LSWRLEEEMRNYKRERLRMPAQVLFVPTFSGEHVLPDAPGGNVLGVILGRGNTEQNTHDHLEVFIGRRARFEEQELSQRPI
jgi:hypothetical protein